jgi:hypothetical protein
MFGLSPCLCSAAKACFLPFYLQSTIYLLEDMALVPVIVPFTAQYPSLADAALNLSTTAVSALSHGPSVW